MVNEIIHSFDLWTTAQAIKTGGRGKSAANQSLNGINKLRELIITMAIQGKLVPQKPEDESAFVVLKKIISKKEQLLKKGILKSQSPLPKIREDEKPFELPGSWAWVRLGEVTNYGLIEKVEPGEVPENTWILELEDIEKETSKLLEKIRVCDKPFQSSKNRFYEGDVIYGKLRPYLDKVIVANEDGICTTEMIPLKGYDSITPDFLRIVMKSSYFIHYASESTHGMNLPRLGTDKARLALFPLVNEAEQRRIVAKVAELMSLCDQLEQQQTQSNAAHEQLVESLLETLHNTAGHEELQTAWQRIASNFDHLFTTEHSIDRLKETILQLAVMGKLVPQNPEDEPASELLKKIGKVKARLIKEGVIKKTKQLSEITVDEIPFELPDGWEFVKLNDIGEWGAGATPNRGKLEYYGGNIPWFKSGELVGDYISSSEEFVTDLALKENSLRYNKAGDVLLAMYGATIGKTSILTVPATTNQAVCACTPFEGIYNVYLLTILKAFKNRFSGMGAGGAQPNISREKIIATIIALPPLLEQHRIVAKVNDLFAICDALKARISDSQTTKIRLADAVVEKALSANKF